MTTNLLHLKDHSQSLPGGTIDNSVEFFVFENDMWCRTQGQTYVFADFPEWVKEKVDADMVNHPEKIAHLVEWGLLDADSQMKQYLFCLYGGHDDNPDICADGTMQPSEYVDCGLRGKCAFEGKLCNSLELANGKLSKQEILFLQLNATGLTDKEIANQLFVSDHTIKYYKTKILEKAGMPSERKTALVGLAYKLGLAK